MNKERILAVADAIEKSINEPSLMGFEMATFGEKDECGIVGCIAGFSCALFKPKDYSVYARRPCGSYFFPYDEAMDLLNLTEDQAVKLFIPGEMYRVTAQDAVKTLRHFAETGKIV